MSKRHAIKSSSKRYFDLRSWWILEFQSFFSLLWHKCIWNRGRSTVAAFRPFFVKVEIPPTTQCGLISIWSFSTSSTIFFWEDCSKEALLSYFFSYAVYEEFIGNFTWRSLTAASVLSVTICFVAEFAMCSLTCFLNTIKLFKKKSHHF